MDELQISGRRFISSRRIAKENGYTSDYVGQLIRGGKVTGQKVGRAWYVDAESFDKYLGGESAVIAPIVQEIPKVAVEPEPVVVAEPIKIVEEVVVKEALDEVKEPTIVEEEVRVEEKVEEPVVVSVPVRVATHRVEIKKEEPVKVTGLRYYQEEEPTLPEIRSNKKESRLSVVVMPERDEELEASEVSVFTPKTKKSSRVAGVFAMVVVGALVLVGSAWLSSAISLNLSITEGSTATATYGINK